MAVRPHIGPGKSRVDEPPYGIAQLGMRFIRRRGAVAARANSSSITSGVTIFMSGLYLRKRFALRLQQFNAQILESDVHCESLMQLQGQNSFVQCSGALVD